MLLQSLAVIGDEIAKAEFPNKFVSITDAKALADVKSVIILEFDGDEAGLSFQGARSVDPTSPAEMAVRFGYVNRYNQYDHSLTKRTSSSLLEALDMLLEWPQSESLGDHSNKPIITALAKEFEKSKDEIRDEVAVFEDSVDYKALLTVAISEDGQERYPGEMDTFAAATFEAYSEKLHTDTQSANDAKGDGRCYVCDKQAQIYGLGANLDMMYSSKKQWPFPQYNASRAWESRPLCAECILSIEVATDRFINQQSFGTAGVRCRVIPYHLPVAGAEDRLRTLIANARPELLDGENEKPLTAAWDVYRKHAQDFEIEEDVLRLAFVHYVRDSAKAHGVGWTDGVSLSQLDRIRETYAQLHAKDIVFKNGYLGPESLNIVPSERQLFTGWWLLSLLTKASGSDHEGSQIGDEKNWVEFTQSILTDSKISYQSVVSHITEEAIARYRDRLSGAPVRYDASISEEDAKQYPFDGFHIHQAYSLLRVLSELDLLEDSRTTMTMTPSSITGDFTSFGDGLKEFISAHTSIAESPGRQAGFILGATAAQLSNWQKRKKLNRTFLQNRSVGQLTARELTRWQRDIWEKAKVYNAQAGNYGIPWSRAESLFHEAIMSGEEGGWNATTDEIQYHFILGVNVGPRIARRARANFEEENGEPPAEEPPAVINPEE